MQARQKRGLACEPLRELPPGSCLPSALQTFAFWKWPLGFLERCREQYGSRFTLRLTGYPPFVFVSEPQDLRAIFTAGAETLHAGEGGRTLEPLIGEDSFMLCDGEEHLAGRRVVAPAFHGRAVQRHAELVQGVALREVSSWPRETPIALHARLHTLTLEIILRVIFGAGRDECLRRLAERLLAMLSITASVVLSEPVLRRGPGGRIWQRFLRERSEVDELIFGLLEELSPRAGGEGGEGAKGGEGSEGGEDGGLLARLFAARNPDGSPMSRRQLRDNVMTTIVSGHETTASELEWAFQLLAHNPAVMNRLLGEIDGDGDEEYLTATVNEVLRHRPAFLFTIPRAIERPIQIGDWTCRAPAQLLGCTYLTHHDPRLYQRPNEFRPERFLGARPAPSPDPSAWVPRPDPSAWVSQPDPSAGVSQQHPSAWLPWGGGRRRCPGRHMAMLEMKTVLRTVLSLVTVHPAARRMEHARWRSVVVTPHAGSRVVLRSRNGPGGGKGT
jgi:cytochrome P450